MFTTIYHSLIYTVVYHSNLLQYVSIFVKTHYLLHMIF